MCRCVAKLWWSAPMVTSFFYHRPVLQFECLIQDSLSHRQRDHLRSCFHKRRWVTTREGLQPLLSPMSVFQFYVFKLYKIDHPIIPLVRCLVAPTVKISLLGLDVRILALRSCVLSKPAMTCPHPAWTHSNANFRLHSIMLLTIYSFPFPPTYHCHHAPCGDIHVRWHDKAPLFPLTSPHQARAWKCEYGGSFLAFEHFDHTNWYEDITEHEIQNKPFAFTHTFSQLEQKLVHCTRTTWTNTLLHRRVNYIVILHWCAKYKMNNPLYSTTKIKRICSCVGEYTISSRYEFYFCCFETFVLMCLLSLIMAPLFLLVLLRGCQSVVSAQVQNCLLTPWFPITCNCNVFGGIATNWCEVRFGSKSQSARVCFLHHVFVSTVFLLGPFLWN